VRFYGFGAQGSACGTTPGWLNESRWDSQMARTLFTVVIDLFTSGLYSGRGGGQKTGHDMNTSCEGTNQLNAESRVRSAEFGTGRRPPIKLNPTKSEFRTRGDAACEVGSYQRVWSITRATYFARCGWQARRARSDAPYHRGLAVGITTSSADFGSRAESDPSRTCGTRQGPSGHHQT